jgi:hypothetical protein
MLLCFFERGFLDSFLPGILPLIIDIEAGGRYVILLPHMPTGSYLLMLLFSRTDNAWYIKLLLGRVLVISISGVYKHQENSADIELGIST